MEKKKKIYLVDWYNFIYRLFYAIPPFTLKDWTPINAVYWMAKTVISWANEDKPDYLVFILDHKWKTVREAIYQDYKWTRDKMPSELKSQESLIFELLSSFWIPLISKEWYEADDLIWTLATKFKWDASNDVFILSWDKDLFQFIDSNIKVYDTMKRKIYSRADAFEKFWVYPENIVDYLSICWDTSDNIPWIPWFWPKKAQELIWKYWSLENIYENIDSIQWKSQETLISNKEVAFLSKKLASIHTDLAIDNFSLENHIFNIDSILNWKAITLLKRFEFKSLLPDDHKWEIKNFDKLWLKITKIKNQEELDSLRERILKSWRIWISTSSKEPFNLESISLFLWQDTIYSIRTWDLDIREFLDKIIDSNLIISSFEMKEDLKRIKW